MESVPGPLKRGQEKCSCPLLSGPGTNQERLFARFFFLEMARPSFELAFDEEIIEAPPKKIFRFASVDEASMDKLDMNHELQGALLSSQSTLLEHLSRAAQSIFRSTLDEY